MVCSQGTTHCITVAEGQRTGKVYTHQVILLRAQIGGSAQVVIGRRGLCLPDPAKDLRLRLGINPYAELLFALDACLGRDQPIDIFPFPP